MNAKALLVLLFAASWARASSIDECPPFPEGDALYAPEAAARTLEAQECRARQGEAAAEIPRVLEVLGRIESRFGIRARLLMGTVYFHRPSVPGAGDPEEPLYFGSLGLGRLPPSEMLAYLEAVASLDPARMGALLEANARYHVDRDALDDEFGVVIHNAPPPTGEGEPQTVLAYPCRTDPDADHHRDAGGFLLARTTRLSPAALAGGAPLYRAGDLRRALLADAAITSVLAEVARANAAFAPADAEACWGPEGGRGAEAWTAAADVLSDR